MANDSLSNKEMDRCSEAAEADNQAAISKHFRPATTTENGFSPRPGIFLKQFSYRDVLQTKSRIGHISQLCEIANTLGYEYMLWNDRVYFVQDGSSFFTGFTRDAVF